MKKKATKHDPVSGLAVRIMAPMEYTSVPVDSDVHTSSKRLNELLKKGWGVSHSINAPDGCSIAILTRETK